MKKLLELRNTKRELHAQMKQIVDNAETEKRSLSADESEKFKALQAQIEETNQAIECAEVLADQERSLIGDKPEARTNEMPTNEELRSFVLNGEMRTASVAVNADGGYTVVPELDRQIYSLLRENSVFRQNAMVQTIGSKTYEKLVSVGGTSANWAGESDTRSATNESKLEKVEISLNSLYAYPATTQELLDWSDFDVAGWLTSEVALQTGEMEETAFWNGDGVKKPKGLLTYTRATTDDATRPFGTVQEIETSVSGIDPDQLIILAHTLRAPYRANAKFYCSDATLETIRKMKDADGQYIWRPGLENGAPDMLLGKPIVVANDVPDDEIVYGDLSRAYTVLDHTSGVRMIRDNITTPGFVKMYTDRYVGGGLVDSDAVKILKITSV